MNNIFTKIKYKCLDITLPVLYVNVIFDNYKYKFITEPTALMRFSGAAIPLFIIVLFLSGCVSYTPNGLPLLYGYYLIKGESMEPILEEPTVVLVKPLPYNTIKPGDIIVFSYRNRLVVHRAVKKLGGDWLTHGDSLGRRDPMRMSYSSYRGMVYMDHNNNPGSKRVMGDLYANDMERARK